jgi:peptide/nickel transport system permease protein
MAARGLQFLLQQWWIPVMPAIGVALLALGANLSGDAVADATGLGA